MCKFHMVYSFQSAKILWQTSVQAKSPLFDLPQNKYFCEIKTILVINQFQTMQNLHLWKKYFFAFAPYLLNDPYIYMYIYIYI